LRDLQEKCGVFGAFTANRYTVRLTYYGLWALQHRGQESSGIASVVGGKIRRHAGEGLVSHVYNEEQLAALKSNMAIGHNRYSTSGGKDGAHLQPIVDDAAGFALAHNGNLPSTVELERFLDVHDISYVDMNDSQMMAAAIGHYVRGGKPLTEAIEAAWPLFTGAFSCVAMDKDVVVGFRDECGIRPLSLGSLEDGFAIARRFCGILSLESSWRLAGMG
jgi:amidophosphoribosyltransferase